MTLYFFSLLLHINQIIVKRSVAVGVSEFRVIDLIPSSDGDKKYFIAISEMAHQRSLASRVFLFLYQKLHWELSGDVSARHLKKRNRLH